MTTEKYISICKDDPTNYTWINYYREGYVWYRNIYSGIEQCSRFTNMKDCLNKDKRVGHIIDTDEDRINKYLLAWKLMK
jgi:hypothetical protein